MTSHRVAGAALAALGAGSAVPVALAQLDFAGVLNAFDIHAGDTPRGLLMFAGVSGVLTIAVIGLALAGAALALSDSERARKVLTTAAVAGFVSATILWIPCGVLLGAAALLIGQDEPGRPEHASAAPAPPTATP